MQEKDKRSLLFILSSVLLVVEVSLVMDIGTVSNVIETSAMIVFPLFFASSFIYILTSSSGNGMQNNATQKKNPANEYLEHNAVALLLLIALSILVLIALQAYKLSTLDYPRILSNGFLLEYTVNFSLFLLSLSLIIIGARIGATQAVRKRKRISYYFLIAAMLVMILFFASGAMAYILNDETFIGIQSFGTLISGKNPYTLSLSAQVYNAFATHAITAPTIISNNTVVGSFEYPILYALTLAPFYYFHNMRFVSHALLPMEIGVFTAFLLFSIFKSTGPKPESMLVYGLVFLIPFFMLSIVSPTTILILVLLILSFWKSSSRYAGILFGITASVQQLSWIPLMLLAIYILNNHGAKRAASVLLTAAAIFLLINAYPLLLNAHAFFSSVFTPVGSAIIPTGGLFGYYLLTIGVREKLVSLLYFAAIAASALTMLFVNKKRLVGPLSLVPFMFLDRDLGIYFTLFVIFTLATMLIRNYGHEDRKNLFIEKLHGYGSKASVSLTVILAALFIVLILYVLVPRPAPFYFYNASVSGHGENMVYSVHAEAGTGGLNKRFSVLLEAMMQNSTYISSFGLYGSNVLYVNGSLSIQPNYTFSPYDVNSNRLELHSSAMAHILINASNIVAARCIIYNSSSFILCPAAEAKKN